MEQGLERASARSGSSQIQHKGTKKGSRATSKRDAKSVQPERLSSQQIKTRNINKNQVQVPPSQSKRIPKARNFSHNSELPCQNSIMRSGSQLQSKKRSPSRSKQHHLTKRSYHLPTQGPYPQDSLAPLLVPAPRIQTSTILEAARQSPAAKSEESQEKIVVNLAALGNRGNTSEAPFPPEIHIQEQNSSTKDNYHYQKATTNTINKLIQPQPRKESFDFNDQQFVFNNDSFEDEPQVMMGKNYGGNVDAQLQPNSGEPQFYGSHLLDSQPNLKCIEYPPSLSSSQTRQAHNQVYHPLYLGSRDLYDIQSQTYTMNQANYGFDYPVSRALNFDTAISSSQENNKCYHSIEQSPFKTPCVVNRRTKLHDCSVQTQPKPTQIKHSSISVKLEKLKKMLQLSESSSQDIEGQILQGSRVQAISSPTKKALSDQPSAKSAKKVASSKPQVPPAPINRRYQKAKQKKKIRDFNMTQSSNDEHEDNISYIRKHLRTQVYEIQALNSLTHFNEQLKHTRNLSSLTGNKVDQETQHSQIRNDRSSLGELVTELQPSGPLDVIRPHSHSFAFQPSHNNSPMGLEQNKDHSIGVQGHQHKQKASKTSPQEILPSTCKGHSHPKAALHVVKKFRCSCKNNKCIQGYCDCLKNGEACSPLTCGCEGCENIEGNTKLRSEIQNKKEKLQREGCNCKKSQCLKKYCECFQAGIACTEKCNCVDCHNTKDILVKDPSKAVVGK